VNDSFRACLYCNGATACSERLNGIKSRAGFLTGEDVAFSTGEILHVDDGLIAGR
jgi:hypothetical protein